MTKDQILLLKHIARRGDNVCRFNCKDRPARAKEVKRLLNLHTSILAEEREC